MLGKIKFRRAASASVGPLVSLVVPCYNVDQYLEEAVTSLLRQTYTNLEIILINDGSKDDTLKLAKKLRRTDKRIRVLTQDNAGLSATRNRGIKQARGEYIWFIDSDDKIPNGAVKKFVDTLEATGSDFAVGNYDRFNSARRWNAALWIREAHQYARLKSNLRDFPEATVNAIACSKMFRRSFLQENNILFPVGITYEDQQVTAECYARAASFDYISEIVYNWRDREDGTSITQQAHTVADLKARINAACESIAILERLSDETAVMARRVQVLSNDLATSTATLQDAPEGYWEELREGALRIIGSFQETVLRLMPPNHASMVFYILNDDFASAVRHLDHSANDVNNYRTRLIDGQVMAEFGNSGYQIPESDDVRIFPDRYLVQYSGIEDFKVGSSGEIHLEGWSFISRLDPSEAPYAHSIQLRNASGETVISFAGIQRVTDTPDFFSKHLFNDYRESGFECELSSPILDSIPNGKFEIWVETRTGDLVRSQPFRRALRSKYFGRATSLNVGNSNKRIRIQQTKDGVYEAVVTSTIVALKSIEFSPVNTNYVRLCLASGPEIHGLEFFDRITGLTEEVSVTSTGEFFEAIVSGDLLQRLAANDTLVLRARGSKKKYAINCAPEVLGDNLLSVNGIRAYRALSGNLSFRPIATNMVHVTRADVTSEGIRIEGEIVGGEASITVSIESHSFNVELPVPSDKEFNVTIPLASEKWGVERRLPTGMYALRFNYLDEQGERKFAPVEVAEVLARALPLENRDAERDELIRLYLRNSYSLAVKINTITGPDNASPREKHRRLEFYRSLEPTLSENTWLLRSYYGESVSCVPRAIGEEVLNRDELASVVYCAVKDSSVLVPEGAIGVTYGSEQWYALLATCAVYVDNTHQPDYFIKRPGQKIVATFHGYPFKVCGEPLWELMGLSVNRKRSFAVRHGQWDFLISPAPYATPLLDKVFPSPATTAEVGYARNDFFFSSNVREVREKTREALGIKSDQVAVLYAPTFRDYLAVDEWRAKMPDFLAVEEFLAELPSNYVLLVRGHAYNMRTSDRVQSGGRVIDVTDYPDINALSVASDVAVLDYSSLRFDYALTGNPMVFLIPDRDRYLSEARGGLIDYEPTAPGPHVLNTTQLCNEIRDLAQLRDRTAEARQQFIREYLPLEDGKAASRTVDLILNSCTGIG